MKKQNSIFKLYCLYDEIFDNELINKLTILEGLENKMVPSESIIFLNNALSSINNSTKLLDDNNFVDSLCLLRSAYELIIFSLAIHFDKQTYEVYKIYNQDLYNEYRKALNKKYEEEKRKNPRFKAAKIEDKRFKQLAPSKMREIVSQNYKLIFNTLFDNCKTCDDVKKELGEFYSYLCDYTHPSICKTYVYKIQNDIENLSNIKYIFKINIYYCKLLLLLCVNYYVGNKDNDVIFDLYGIIFLLSCSLVDDVKKLKRTLNKYSEYLYLNINKNYFKTYKKELDEIKKEISNINENNAINFGDKLMEIILTFNAQDLCYKYLGIKL